MRLCHRQMSRNAAFPAGSRARSFRSLHSHRGTHSMSPALIEVRNLVCEYRLRRTKLLGPRPVLRAVADVSFDIRPGRSFAVVGESGSGKSTLGRAVLALEKPVSGEVRLNGANLFGMNAGQ